MLIIIGDVYKLKWKEDIVNGRQSAIDRCACGTQSSTGLQANSVVSQGKNDQKKKSLSGGIFS